MRTTIRTFSSFLLALVTALISAGPANAATSLALGSVTGTAQVHGATKPGMLQTLLAQTFNSQCRLFSAERQELSTAAVTGPVSGRLELLLTLMSCPASSEQPTTHCGWSITPRPPLDASCRTEMPLSPPTSGSDTFAGWRGGLTIPLPARTGSYDLTLRCEIRDDDRVDHEQIERPLHVTYAPPLAVYSPPATPWLEKASCWGAGFEADAKPRAVLKAMLNGLYRYGREHWRYGYSWQQERALVFPGHDEEFRIIEERITCGQRGRCKCIWEAVLDNTRCDFADCFIFSDAFQAVAGVFGILTLAECPTCTISGTEGLGFLTTPDPPSFDHEFPRAVICVQGSPACPATYYFGKHALVFRQGSHYDPTFDRILGPNPNEAVDSVLAIHHLEVGDRRTITILESATTTIQQLAPSLYGTWSFYRRLEPIHAPPSEQAVQFITARFMPLPDADADADADAEPYTALEATVELRCDTDGIYALHGALYKGDRLISQHPAWRTENTTHVPVAGRTGEVRTAQLQFSGQDIYRSHEDGPYELRLYAIDERGFSYQPHKTFFTPPFAFESYGERSVTIRSVKAEWTAQGEEKAKGAALRVEMALFMRLTSPLRLELELATEDRILGNASLRCDEPCRRTVGRSGREIFLNTTIPIVQLPRSTATLTLAVWDDGETLEPAAGRVSRVPVPGEEDP